MVIFIPDTSYSWRNHVIDCGQNICLI